MLFNRVLLDNAKNRIRALGFFKKDSVDVTEEPGSSDDRTIVKVKVEEEATGELAFSAGFSSQDAFLFSASATQRNFRGRGQYLTAAHPDDVAPARHRVPLSPSPSSNDRNMAVGRRSFRHQLQFYAASRVSATVWLAFRVACNFRCLTTDQLRTSL